MTLRKLWWWTSLIMLSFLLTSVFSHSAEGEQKQVWKRHGNKWEIDNSHGAIFTVYGQVSGATPSSALASRQSTFSQSLSTDQSSQIPLQASGVIEPWIHFSITGTRLDWFVRKPGAYAMKGASLTIESNTSVLVDFDGFGNLTNSENPDKSIQTFYGIEQPAAPIGQVSWIKASDLNSSDRFLIFSESSPSTTLDLWNLIFVSQSNSSCEYEDDAYITLTVQNLSTWIELGNNQLVDNK